MTVGEQLIGSEVQLTVKEKNCRNEAATDRCYATLPFKTKSTSWGEALLTDLACASNAVLMDLYHVDALHDRTRCPAQRSKAYGYAPMRQGWA